MADIKDVTTVIASALSEVSATGTLDVHMDGGEVVESIGPACGDDLEVVVVVKRVGEGQGPAPKPDR